MPTRAQQWLARGGLIVASGLSVGLFVGLPAGLIFGLSDRLFGGVADGLIVASALALGLFGGVAGLGLGFIVGMIGGLSGAALKLQPVEKARFSWTDVSSRKSVALRDGLIVGLSVWLIFGLGFGLMSVGLGFGLSEGLSTGLFSWPYGLICGLIGGLTRLLTSEAIPDTRSAVNEGTYRSIRVALMSLLIVGLSVWLIFGLGFGLLFRLYPASLKNIRLFPEQTGALSAGLIMGLPVGLIGGLIGGLISGGLFALKHFVLRLLLWKSGSAPLRYGGFLAQARDLLFLRQVGGGYIFVHPLLREYFVSLSVPKNNRKKGTHTAPAATQG